MKLLTKVLTDYDLRTVAPIVGGLMTLPAFHANSVRLELLAQLAAGACAGKKRPSHQHLSTWLNRQLGGSEVVLLEDPAEDVFVVNVTTSQGDFRVLSGLWEEGDHATSLLLETLTQAPPLVAQEWMGSALALLRLSDAVIGRSQLDRWQMESSSPKGTMRILPPLNLGELGGRVKFSQGDLRSYGIDPAHLDAFVLEESARPQLLFEEDEETALHRRPLLRLDDHYVLAMPNAVAYAVRRYVLDCAAEANLLRGLNTALMMTVQARLARIGTHGSRHRTEFLTLPPSLRGVHGTCSSMVVAVGERRFVHYLLVADDIQQTAHFGLLHPQGLAEEAIARVDEHVTSVRQYIESTVELGSGHTVVLSGFLGQAVLMPEPPGRERWTFVSFRLGDLAMFLRDSDSPLDRMILLLNQEQEFARQGLELPFYNGFLNLYQFWVQQGFYLRINDVAHDAPAYLQIGTDFVAKYRRARRIAVDEHCVQLPDGRSTVVQRSNTESVYASLRALPVYVSLDLLEDGVLAFCLEVHGTLLWVTARPPKTSVARKPVFELWQALQLLVHRALTAVSPAFEFVAEIVEVVLDFSDLIGQEEAVRTASSATGLRLEASAAHASVTIHADSGFLRSFENAENRGEQYLLAEVLRAVSMLSSYNLPSGLDFLDAARQVLGGTAARVLHTFRVWTDVEHLLAADSLPVYRRPDEHIESSIRAAFTWMAAPSRAVELDSRGTTDALNRCVQRQVERLQERLQTFNRIELVRKLLHLHESLIRDKQRWRSTARAVRALYGEHDGTRAAQEAERVRAQLQLALRALVEAATCECSDGTRLEADEYQLDEIVGLMATIIDLGRDSDVVYFGLASRGMTLYPNGAYALDADLLAELAAPFMSQSFEEEYSAAAERYEDWVRTEAPARDRKPDSVFDSAAFHVAWRAEYGHSFEAFQEIAGEIQDVAVKERQVVLTASAAAIAANRKDAGVTLEDVRAFVQAFGLPRRPAWPPKAPAASPRDVMPWRFERRLSVSLRPLVLEDGSGDGFVYGVGTAREAFAYILDGIESATFDKDVFRSTEMRAWLGARVDALGREFAERVAERLRALGWTAVAELRMTRLGAPKSPDLGDVDVLAWRADGAVLAIECKRLKASRTIAEIAQNCERFRGNVGDLLHKHLRRRAWIEGNQSKLAAFCKLDAAMLQPWFPLVVNRVVPFKYLASLPVPASEIILDSKLDEFVTRLSIANGPSGRLPGGPPPPV